MPKPKFKSGDTVRLRTRPEVVGVVTGEPSIFDDEYFYNIFISATVTQRYAEGLLESAEITDDARGMLRQQSWGGIEGLVRTWTYTRITGRLSDHLYAILSARTQLLPHQFKPVLKYLESYKKRLLIADEVGLGKTIEAGYILLEQAARTDLKRCLVVCPASLRTKWQMELRQRFGLTWDLVNLPQLFDFLKDYQDFALDTDFTGIASLQAIRNRRFLAEWEAINPEMDLVIVDEAHHMRNTGTLSNRTGRLLSDSATGMLMLTATPVQIGNENLFNLLRILDDEEFDNFQLFSQNISANRPLVRAYYELADDHPETLANVKERLDEAYQGFARRRLEGNPTYESVLERLNAGLKNRREFIELRRDVSELNLLSHIFTRTKKREVDMGATRKAQTYRVEFTEEEKNFYDAVTDHVIETNLHASSGWASLRAMMPQRQVASCIHAAIEYWKDRYQDMFHEMDVEESDFSTLMLDEPDNSNNGEEEIWRSGILDLVNRARELGNTDSKYNTCLEAIRVLHQGDPHRKIIIFSFFKRTLSYLQRKLRKDGLENLVLSGDFRPQERDDIINRFKEEPGLKILLSSEVGSEGLDLQFCSAMVNYDLPWNPMVVEQRIGRLDRFGQQAEVINIINLAVADTIEQRILDRLYLRLGIFEESIGDLEDILGEDVNKLVHELLATKLTPEEQSARIERYAEILEERKKDLQILEEKSVHLVGHDEYFSEEIRRLIDEKRYLTSEELRRYIAEFLKSKYPRCSIATTDKSEIFRMKVDEQFEQFVRSKVSSSQLLQEYLVRSTSGTLQVTFDGETANRNRDIVFLNHYHPVIEAITTHYFENPVELAPVSRVEVAWPDFSGRKFLYFLYEIETSAARISKTLEPVFVDLENYSIVNDEISDPLFAEMVTGGNTLPGIPRIPQNKVDEVDLLAEGEIVRRIKERMERQQRYNESLIHNRIEGIKQSFDIKIRKANERLEQTRANQRDQRLVRMFEGQIRNLAARRDEKIAEEDSRRSINISHRLMAGGFVRIVG